MALLFMDGFDHYATADMSKKWTAAGGSILASSGRRSGGCMAVTGTTYKALPSSYSALIVGFAYDNNSNSTAGDILRVNEGGTATIHVSVRINADLSLSVMRGGSSGTVLSSTSAGLISSSGFTYIELKCNIHDSTGSYTLRINGVTVTSGSGVDTRNSGTTGLVNAVQFNSPGATIRIDDLYVCDTSGSAPTNDLLGDCRVDTLLPNGDGNYTQFTCSTGSTHYTLVDESTPNTSDYNESSTAAQKDSYQMVNLSALTATIYGVQVSGAILKDDAGARSIKVGCRSSTTDSVSSAFALSTSQAFYSNVHETDPATSAAWTESGVNAAEALFEIV